MYYIFFIHYSADGHLGCFYDLITLHSTAMNIGVHVPFLVSFKITLVPPNTCILLCNLSHHDSTSTLESIDRKGRTDWKKSEYGGKKQERKLKEDGEKKVPLSFKDCSSSTFFFPSITQVIHMFGLPNNPLFLALFIIPSFCPLMPPLMPPLDIFFWHIF